MQKEGRVYWITGLSGAGKTTIGKALKQKLTQDIIFLDGDMLRKVYGDDIGYSIADRYRMAMRNAKLCALLSSQGFNVICCTIGMFHNVRDWNKNNIKDYQEIYLKVSKETLIKRDKKTLYTTKQSGVVGVDLEFEEPLNPTLVIENEGILTVEEVVDKILSHMP